MGVENAEIADVTAEYVYNACKLGGEVVAEEGYHYKNHDEEVELANWIFEMFGGDLILLKESGTEKTADYRWNGKFWELKTLFSHNEVTVDKRIRKGCRQIESNAGGLILDFCNDMGQEQNEEMALRSIAKRARVTVDVIIKTKDEFRVFRVKK